jgi:hypothetical protein
MSYTVFETHVVYENNKLTLVAVLWESNQDYKWVRASYCINKVTPGYGYIKPDDIISPELIQEVAGYGMNLPDNLKKRFFPGKRKWER